jgi:hypothetical protein
MLFMYSFVVYLTALSVSQRNAYRILVGKPEGKRPLGRPKRWWEDNIKMDLRMIKWGVMCIYVLFI